jgi:hypothetical protein
MRLRRILKTAVRQATGASAPASAVATAPSTGAVTAPVQETQTA